MYIHTYVVAFPLPCTVLYHLDIMKMKNMLNGLEEVTKRPCLEFLQKWPKASFLWNGKWDSL